MSRGSMHQSLWRPVPSSDDNYLIDLSLGIDAEPDLLADGQQPGLRVFERLADQEDEVVFTLGIANVPKTRVQVQPCDGTLLQYRFRCIVGWHVGTFHQTQSSASIHTKLAPALSLGRRFIFAGLRELGA